MATSMQSDLKFAIAQIQSQPQQVDTNIDLHLKFIEKAILEKADAIVFPELSLTNYEPADAKAFAFEVNDSKLAIFQQKSNEGNITICLGVPTVANHGVHISMLVFQPNQNRQVYHKQLLHKDEQSYFVPGQHQLIFQVKNRKIVPAICYESLQSVHAEKASQLGGDIYLASVAKPSNGVQKAYDYYPKIAAKYGFIVIMSNAVGCCDNFISAGGSASWNINGECMGQLSKKEEGLLFICID